MKQTWYDEIGVSVNNDNDSSFNENRIDNSSNSLSNLVMVVSTIWMIISGFIPIIKENFMNHTIDSWSYYKIDGLFAYMHVNSIDANLLYMILCICLAFYAVGIVFALMFFIKMFSSRKMVDKIAFYAILSSLLLSASTIVIIFAHIVINIKTENVYVKLTLMPGGWITVAVLIINIIVAKKYSKYHKQKLSKESTDG